MFCFQKTMSIVGGETTDEELTEFLHKAMKMIQVFRGGSGSFWQWKSKKMSGTSKTRARVSGTGKKSPADWRDCGTVWCEDRD